MSRVGKKIISIPSNVNFEFENNVLKVTGPNGMLSRKIDSSIKIESKDRSIAINRVDETRKSKALHGLFRSLIFNMIKGVSLGFRKNLTINGVGYKAEVIEEELVLSLGYSHKVNIEIPKNISIEVDKKKTSLSVSSLDKELLGMFVAKVRSIRPPEPYKGKGIRYENEIVKQKEGKASSR